MICIYIFDVRGVLYKPQDSIIYPSTVYRNLGTEKFNHIAVDCLSKAYSMVPLSGRSNLAGHFFQVVAGNVDFRLLSYSKMYAQEPSFTVNIHIYTLIILCWNF